MFKKSIATLATLIALTLTATSAYSGDRVLTGTILGAGGGALLGQAIGGDADSVIIGTALGGIVGLAASSSNQHHYTSSRVHTGYRDYDRHSYSHKRHYPSGHRYIKHKHYRSYPRHYRHAPECRVIVKHFYDHGRSVKIKKRICDTGGHRHYNKGHNRHNRDFDSRPRHHRW